MSTTNTTATAPQIYTLMSRIMGSVGAVGKTRTNEHFKFKFRGIDEMQNAVHPALVEHGVCMTSEVMEERREPAAKGTSVVLKMRFTWYAPDGSSVATVTVGEGLDAQDKATNKAMSAALKYALLHTFCVPTEDQSDSDADGPVERHGEARREPVALSQTTAQRVGAYLARIDGARDVAALQEIARALQSETADVKSGARARYEGRMGELRAPSPVAPAAEVPAAVHEAVHAMEQRIREITSVPEANNWRKKHAAEIAALPEADRADVLATLAVRVQTITGVQS